MIFHENRLLADDTHVISYLVFVENWDLSSAAVVIGALRINSFLVSGDFCCLLITFINSLDQDQDSQNIGPGLDPSRLTLGYYSSERFF